MKHTATICLTFIIITITICATATVHNYYKRKHSIIIEQIKRVPIPSGKHNVPFNMHANPYEKL